MSVAIEAGLRNTPRSELALASVVVYELEYGTLRSGMPERRRRQLERGLANIERVPFDTEAALMAAGMRVELERRGLAISPVDLMIAGTALSRGATLITNNAAEFSRVAGLRVADWRS